MAQKELTLFQEVDNLIESYMFVYYGTYEIIGDEDDWDKQLRLLECHKTSLSGYQQEELPTNIVRAIPLENGKQVAYCTKLKADYLVAKLESMLVSANKDTREFIFNRIFRNLDISPFEIPDVLIKKGVGYSSAFDINPADCNMLQALLITYRDISDFFYNVKLLCAECGDDVYKYCKGNVDLISEGFNEPYFLQKYNTLQQQTQPYTTLKPTHRRAVLSQLLTRLGFDAETDKTARAKFIEAVVGGNIEAKPKDSASYKKPTKDALEAAEEWLKLIGVDENYRKRILK